MMKSLQILEKAELLLLSFVFLFLPSSILLGADTPVPPKLSQDRLLEVIRDGVAWLITHQHPDGGWGSHQTARPIEVFCTVPGSHNAFRVSTSALAVLALEDNKMAFPEGREAASKGIDYLLRAYNVKRVSGEEHYSVWAFGFTLHCFGRWMKDHPEDPRLPPLTKACEHLMEKLTRYQSLDGGWGYLSIEGLKTYTPASTSMSFTTATLLVGIDRARSAGIAFPEDRIARAVASIARTETPTGSFCYGELWRKYPLNDINQVKGSACRTPACQYALLLFGRDYKEEQRSKALDDLLETQLRFQKIGVRRPIPHEAWYSISGYFYLYGMAYASYLMETLPESIRIRYAEPLFQGVMYCHQPDGSFWDYPLYSYHKPYGTAFALIALSRVEVPHPDH
ncbi:MAG: hypothetical protein ABIK28_11715 [Planctomycetota bacterium]